MRQFRWGMFLLFTLSNKRISCYAAHAIYAAYQGDKSIFFSNILLDSW